MPYILIDLTRIEYDFHLFLHHRLDEFFIRHLAVTINIILFDHMIDLSNGVASVRKLQMVASQQQKFKTAKHGTRRITALLSSNDSKAIQKQSKPWGGGVDEGCARACMWVECDIQ